MINNNFTRSDAIIALGGGVVGDLSGFISSTYMRGITFYNIPTTLLSQVDSSIGGKTAIDFNKIKNIIGTFYQPSKVLIDPNTLKTLSKRQLHSGLVEAIKMSLTNDASLFELIKNSNDIFDDINEIIYKSLLIKKDIVEKDEKESNLRRVLNFGHTIGHAFESQNFPSLLHGECVGLGMLYFCDHSVKQQLIEVLKKYNLPTNIDYIKDEIVSLIEHDKKATSNGVNIVFVKNIGEYELTKLTIKEIQDIL
jgi:3-dehydroquinate synthase